MGRLEQVFTASSVKPWDFTDGLSMYGQSRAILLGKCTQYHLFSGYRGRFRYGCALGLLLLEKLRMSAKTYEFDYIRVFIEPDQQGIAFYVALHAVFIFA